MCKWLAPLEETDADEMLVSRRVQTFDAISLTDEGDMG
jgi:hypothetical protein